MPFQFKMASIDDVQDSLDKLMRQVFEAAHGYVQAVDVVTASQTTTNTNTGSSSSSNPTQTVATSGTSAPTIHSIATEKVEQLKLTFDELKNQIQNLHGIDMSKSQLDAKMEAINSEYRKTRIEILQLDKQLDQKLQEIDSYLEKVHTYVILNFFPYLFLMCIPYVVTGAIRRGDRPFQG